MFFITESMPPYSMSCEVKSDSGPIRLLTSAPERLSFRWFKQSH